MKNLLASLALAVLLCSCAASGPAPYAHTQDSITVIELGDHRQVTGRWTVPASSVKVDSNTDELTAPGIPHPLHTYRVQNAPDGEAP